MDTTTDKDETSQISVAQVLPSVPTKCVIENIVVDIRCSVFFRFFFYYLKVILLWKCLTNTFFSFQHNRYALWT